MKDGNDEQKRELKELLTTAGDVNGRHARLEKVRAIFQACDVFEKAEILVERTREKAESIVEAIEDTNVRDLLWFFTETILARELPPTNLEANPGILVELNTVANGSLSLLPIIGGSVMAASTCATTGVPG